MTVHGSYNSYIYVVVQPSRLRTAGQRTVERAYLVEVRDLSDIYEVDDCKVLHFFRDRVERFVHRHALVVPIMTKANHNDTILFRFDCFVDMPTAGKVRKEVGHGDEDVTEGKPEFGALKWQSGTATVRFHRISSKIQLLLSATYHRPGPYTVPTTFCTPPALAFHSILCNLKGIISGRLQGH